MSIELSTALSGLGYPTGANTATKSDVDAVVLGSGNITPEQAATISSLSGMITNAQEIDAVSQSNYSSSTISVYSELLITNNNKRLAEDGTLITDNGWQTSDYIPIIRKSIVRGYGYGVSRVVLATYNKNKEFISFYYGTVPATNTIYNYTELTLTSQDCAFVRIVSSTTLAILGSIKHNLFLTEEYNLERIYKSSGAKTRLLVDSYTDKLLLNSGKRLQDNGTLVTDASWQTSDYIPVTEQLVVKGYAFGTARTSIATYDINYQLINFYYADTPSVANSIFYYRQVELSPSDCAYVRVSGAVGSKLFSNIQKYAVAEDVINTLPKKNNEEKAVFFTVNVNQNFQDITNTAQTIQDSESFLPVYCAMYLPTSYRASGKPTKIAVVMHGAGGMVSDTSYGELSNWISILVNAGYAVFDVNGSNNNYVSHSDHMGGRRAMEAYNKAFEYIKDNYNVEDKLYVQGGSMGGLTALNFTNTFPDIVKCLGLYMPVTDMYNQAWLRPWYPTTKQQIATEYNFTDNTGNTWEADKVVGFNPIENAIVSKPIKIWHGDADSTVLISGSQALIARLKSSGVQAYLRTVSGMNHVATPTAIKQELVYWFNRF